MPAGHSWNLAAWMSALGIRRKEQPDVMHVVQPVEIVGDHSIHAAPILAPMVWAGGQCSPAAGQHAVLQLASRSPGGVYVRELHYVGSSALGTNFRITDSPFTLANIVTPTPYNMGPTDGESLCRLGTVATASLPAAATQPTLITATQLILSDWWYVPSGSYLEIYTRTAAVVVNCGMFWEELPAQPAAR